MALQTMHPEPDWAGPRVFLDLAIEDRPIGRVIIELYPNVCPRTCENFRQLCTGEYRPKGVPIGFRDTKFHRVIPGFIIQGGDCDTKDGNGSLSIYGYQFDDEQSALRFSEPGVVAMANSGPNSNGCQFFITLSSASSLEGHYVSFGKVITGMLSIRQIESIPLKPNSEEPSLNATVIQCGEM